MDFFEVLRRRRSIRAYQTKPVGDEMLTRIFEAANLAPSAGNLQAYKVHVFRDPEKRKALAKAAYDQKFVAEAPVSLVFCADPSRSGERYGKRGAELYSVQDATIAGTYAILAATDIGLATVWVGEFDHNHVTQIVGDKSLYPVAIVSVGYPAEEPPPTARRAIEEIFQGDFPHTD